MVGHCCWCNVWLCYRTDVPATRWGVGCGAAWRAAGLRQYVGWCDGYDHAVWQGHPQGAGGVAP